MRQQKCSSVLLNSYSKTKASRRTIFRFWKIFICDNFNSKNTFQFMIFFCHLFMTIQKRDQKFDLYKICAKKFQNNHLTNIINFFHFSNYNIFVLICYNLYTKFIETNINQLIRLHFNMSSIDAIAFKLFNRTVFKDWKSWSFKVINHVSWICDKDFYEKKIFNSIESSISYRDSNFKRLKKSTFDSQF